MEELTQIRILLQRCLNAIITIGGFGYLSTAVAAATYLTITNAASTYMLINGFYSAFNEYSATPTSITGDTTLNMTSLFSSPAISNLYNWFNVSSGNGTETITNITNNPTFPFYISPAAGLTITITHKANGSAGWLRCSAATVSANGTNGDWLEFFPDPKGGAFLYCTAHNQFS